jgi:CheY-like chemotaxis protein
VEISFEDHGIGLTAEQQIRIFELFAQVDTAIERARGGLGIGLTLARRIVEMHGGQLLVHSAGPGKGSLFIVRLPLKPVAAPEPAPAPPPVRDPHAVIPRRALVVDDNQDAADTLATILQLLGHTTHCVSDPHEVVDAVEAFAPDVVFLDIGMPGLSGYDVARRLRSHATNESLTLVALTGWGQPEDRRRTAETGFDHHLVKPAELASIQRIFDGLPSRRREPG